LAPGGKKVKGGQKGGKGEGTQKKGEKGGINQEMTFDHRKATKHQNGKE